MKKKTTSFMALVVLLVSCAEENGTTIRVDPEIGSYWFHPGNQTLGPMGLVVNGSHALEGAFLFHGADSLVAINSLGPLDLIAVFKGNNTGGTVHLMLINSGDENQVIKQVKMFNLVLEEGFRVAGMNAHQVELEGSYLPARGFCLQTETGGLWDFTFEHQGDSLTCDFNGSGASIILLPEEKLSLPPLEFFYHLCPH